MGRPKNAPTRTELEKYPLNQLRTLLKEATEIERAKAKADKLRRAAEAARMRDLIGQVVLTTLPPDDLATFMRKLIPPHVTDPKDLALFDQWLKPGPAAS